MEESLDRRSEIVSLETATINEMLKPLLLPKMVAAKALTAGRANTIYKLELEDTAEALVLRLHIRDQSSCQKEYNIFKALHHIVPMAEFLYIEPSPSRFGFPYSVLKWVDGVHLTEVITSPDTDKVAPLAKDVGAKLAAIGSYRFSQPGLFDQNLEIVVPFTSTADSWLSFIERCLFVGQTGKQLGAEWTERLWQYVNENVAFLADLPEENCFVHADFRESNLLVKQVKGNWQLAAVLDWEFAYAGSPLADIGPLLRHSAQLNPVFESAFADGFEQQGGKLPPNWKQLVRLLDLLNLCDFLNRPHISAVMHRDVRQLIIDTIES